MFVLRETENKKRDSGVSIFLSIMEGMARFRGRIFGKTSCFGVELQPFSGNDIIIHIQYIFIGELPISG